jgi:hypothetical protein
VPLTDVWVAASGTGTPGTDSVIKLANQIATFYGAVFVGTYAGQWVGHINDTVAHVQADATNTLSAAVQAVDLPTAETLTALLRTQIQAHFTQSEIHINNDGQTINDTSITSLATCITVINSIRTCLLAHIINAPNFGEPSASAPFGIRTTTG